MQLNSSKINQIIKLIKIKAKRHSKYKKNKNKMTEEDGGAYKNINKIKFKLLNYH